MGLTQSMAIRVPVRLQDRGRDIYRKGRVLRIRGDDHEVDAKVVGNGGLYSVALDLADGSLAYSCSCPYFEGNERVCKHVWAVLIAAER
ncbi:MAG: SWIM zinc finger family protein, partial [Actinomycetota bacterium]